MIHWARLFSQWQARACFFTMPSCTMQESCQHGWRYNSGVGCNASELPYISPSDTVTASPIRAVILYSIWQLESFLWELQPQVTGVNVKSTVRVSNTFFPFALSQPSHLPQQGRVRGNSSGFDGTRGWAWLSISGRLHVFHGHMFHIVSSAYNFKIDINTHEVFIEEISWLSWQTDSAPSSHTKASVEFKHAPHHLWHNWSKYWSCRRSVNRPSPFCLIVSCCQAR